MDILTVLSMTPSSFIKLGDRHLGDRRSHSGVPICGLGQPEHTLLVHVAAMAQQYEEGDGGEPPPPP